MNIILLTKNLVIECLCNTIGSENENCDDRGFCNCKCNVVGSKCDECASEFYNFPECIGKS